MPPFGPCSSARGSPNPNACTEPRLHVLANTPGWPRGWPPLMYMLLIRFYTAHSLIREFKGHAFEERSSPRRHSHVTQRVRSHRPPVCLNTACRPKARGTGLGWGQTPRAAGAQRAGGGGGSVSTSRTPNSVTSVNGAQPRRRCCKTLVFIVSNATRHALGARSPLGPNSRPARGQAGAPGPPRTEAQKSQESSKVWSRPPTPQHPLTPAQSLHFPCFCSPRFWECPKHGEGSDPFPDRLLPDPPLSRSERNVRNGMFCFLLFFYMSFKTSQVCFLLLGNPTIELQNRKLRRLGSSGLGAEVTESVEHEEATAEPRYRFSRWSRKAPPQRPQEGQPAGRRDSPQAGNPRPRKARCRSAVSQQSPGRPG